MDEFAKYKIKDYQYWSLSIDQNQGYLGQCVVWCNRDDALDLAGATSEEVQELLAILKKIIRALKKAFQPDRFNYAFLGNETNHLHAHVIPRYASARQFNGMTFKDELWGRHYRTDNVSTPVNVLEKIRLHIQQNLE